MGYPLLLELYSAWSSVPKDWALVGHCIFCASMIAPDLKPHFLVHFWISFLGGFGGGTLSALLMQNPSKAPVTLLASNQLGVCWVLCWWAMNYFPGNVPGKIHSFWPVQMVTHACVAFCRTHLMIGRVELATELFPGVLLAPLILATLAGSGGKFIVDTMRLLLGSEHRRGPHEGWVQGWSWRSALLVGAFYFLAVKHQATAFLLPQEATAVLLTLLVSHSLVSDLVGAPLDFTQPIVALGMRLINIPQPTAAASPAPKPGKGSAKQQNGQALNGSAHTNGTGEDHSGMNGHANGHAAAAAAPAPSAKANGGSVSLLSQKSKPTDFWNARVNGLNKDKDKGKKKPAAVEAKKVK